MELEVGQRATRELVVDEEMVRKYAEITGDYNPLHFDAEFAAHTRFGRLMAQGGIATGMLHGPGGDGAARAGLRLHAAELDLSGAGLHWGYASRGGDREVSAGEA